MENEASNAIRMKINFENDSSLMWTVLLTSDSVHEWTFTEEKSNNRIPNEIKI